jgi:hypothetical protein
MFCALVGVDKEDITVTCSSEALVLKVWLTDLFYAWGEKLVLSCNILKKIGDKEEKNARFHWILKSQR